MVLPELGGRIHVGYDKTAGYDFFYRNNVIKPALVGLAGPWISGGVEFNWPQHHRPGDVPAGRRRDRARAGRRGDRVVLRPRPVRADEGHARHPAAARPRRHRTAGPAVQPDRGRADVPVVGQRRGPRERRLPVVLPHRRALRRRPRQAGDDHLPARLGPLLRGRLPGRGHDEQRPATATGSTGTATSRCPTSYMCLGSEDDFFGGYDHGAQAGFVHWADHRIAPGKKQWTWGNAPFGWAWDRNLTDADGPYVELMAGVFTDNQPDFSFLAPGETKTFSQYWYPIQQIGPAHQAKLDAAVRLALDGGHRPGRRVAVTAVRPGCVGAAARRRRRPPVGDDGGPGPGLAARGGRPADRPDDADGPGADRRARGHDADRVAPPYRPRRGHTARPRHRAAGARRRSLRSTSCTSPGCTWTSTGTRRGHPSRTGRRRCAATRATSAARSRSPRGATATAAYDEAERLLRQPSPARPCATRTPTTARRTTGWGWP